MNMKTFCAAGKHSRVRPLHRPKPDLRQDAFIAPNQFAKNTAVTLRVNSSLKDLHAGNPDLANRRAGSIERNQFAGIETAGSDPRRQIAVVVIAGPQHLAGRRIKAPPQFILVAHYVVWSRHTAPTARTLY